MTAAEVPAPPVVSGTHVFPVRHHSPRASATLRLFLDAINPEVVLIEGPSDATPLLEVLVDPETRPPVAILAYRTDGTPGSAMWPFADYSPEYVAASWAHAHQRRVELIDLTTGEALAAQAAGIDGDIPASDSPGTEPAAVTDGDPAQDDEASDPGERVARDRGFRGFEEFWEASFEAPAFEAAGFRDALLAWADVVRAHDPSPYHRARDAVMAAHVERVVADGVPADRVAVVVGAAHAAAFVAGDVDAALAATLPDAVPCTVTLVPYSFPRLARQLGYGAGNRAPAFYQRAHDAGADYRRATLEVLISFGDHLRLRGFAVSLADTIEAYRLAVMLAGIRGKAEPGLDEVREAAIAAMCRGDATPVDGFLWATVVGADVGRVAARIGRNSLQEEFWNELEARRLPRTDTPERLILHLNNAVEIGTSVFLHRLRIGGIPYASLEAVGSGAAALARPRETWEAQWTPATDAALVEAVVVASSLEDLAADRLDAALGVATGAGAAAEVVLQSVLASCPRVAAMALDACERLAADDADLPSLAVAARALSGLVAYGTSRAHVPGGEALIPSLLAKVFVRAVLRVEDACTGNDEAVAPALEALRTLHEVAQGQPLVDRAAWITAARGLLDSYAVNAGASGMAGGLLYVAGELPDDQLATVVGQRLSNRLEPVEAATFLAGFFTVNAVALVRNRAVVATLDDYLTGLDGDQFRAALPVLRRALSGLGRSERRYLAEHLVALRGVGAGQATAILAQGDTDALKSMGDEVSALLDDLGDLF